MANALIQPSFAAGELAPSLLARVDLAKYHVGARLLRNMFVHPHGGASNRPGTQFVGRAKDSVHPVRLVPFQFSTLQTYVLEFGHQYMRVIKEGGHVLEPSKAIVGITNTSPGVLTVNAHGYANGDQVFIAGAAGMTQVNSTPGRQYLVANATTNSLTLTNLDGQAVDTTAFAAYAGAGTIARVFTLTTPYAGTDLATLKFTQDKDTMTLCHPSYPPKDLTRTQHYAWALADITFQPTLAAPTGVAASCSSTGTWNYGYIVTAETDDPPEESRGSTIALCTGAQLNQDTGVQNTVTWTAMSGASRFKIYKAQPSLTAAIPSGAMYGYIGRAEGTSFIDANIGPDFTQAPPEAKNPFAGTNWPGAVEYFSQRKLFGGSTTGPQTFWGTQPGAYRNMDTSSPSRDSDAITVQIYARQVNAIKFFVPMSSLLVLTAGGAWKIVGTDQSTVLAPGKVEAKPQAFTGCADLPPIIIGSDVLYVQAMGSVVRNLSLDYYADVFKGADMSVLSNHLFYGYTLKEWAYAEEPFKLVWVVRSDGALLCFTYLKEQDVYAWTSGDSPGNSGQDQAMSVASVREGNENAVYLVFSRTIPGVNGGQPVQYIERLHSRNMLVNGSAGLGASLGADVTKAWFADCGLQYSDPVTKTTTVTGLDHLNGCTVSILADGNVQPRQVVANGSVTIQHAANTITVGLPFRSLLRTLPIDIGGGGGTVQGKRKQVPAVTVRLENSRGMTIGPDLDSLVGVKERTNQPYGQAIPLFTGDERVIIPSTWSVDGSIWIAQDDPLPLTVLGVIPEVRVGDTPG